MNKGINYACSELKNNIGKLVNQSGLPIVNIRYILSELLQEVAIVESKVVAEEKEAYEKQLTENKDKKSE